MSYILNFSRKTIIFALAKTPKTRNMKYSGFIIFITVTFAMLFAGCNTETQGEKIDAAEVAFQSEDYETAQEIASKVVSSDSPESQNWKNLCRLSILFMQLSEHQLVEDNVATAVTCYHQAMDAEPDSATEFFNDLPLEDGRYISMLSELNKYYGISTDSIYIEDNDAVDSLYNSLENGQE